MNCPGGSVASDLETTELPTRLATTVTLVSGECHLSCRE